MTNTDDRVVKMQFDNADKALEAEANRLGYTFGATPFGAMNQAELAIPDHPIPVMAEINGKKVQIGTGVIDPETFIFTTTLDEDSPYTEIILDRAGKRGGGYTGMVSVSQMDMTYLGDVEKKPVIDNARLHSISLVKDVDPEHGSFPIVSVNKDVGEIEPHLDTPLPRFHNHD